MGEFLGIIIMILLGLFAYFLCKLNDRSTNEKILKKKDE